MERNPLLFIYLMRLIISGKSTANLGDKVLGSVRSSVLAKANNYPQV